MRVETGKKDLLCLVCGSPTNRLLCSDQCKQEYYKGWKFDKSEIVKH